MPGTRNLLVLDRIWVPQTVSNDLLVSPTASPIASKGELLIKLRGINVQIEKHMFLHGDRGIIEAFLSVLGSNAKYWFIMTVLQPVFFVCFFPPAPPTLLLLMKLVIALLMPLALPPESFLLGLARPSFSAWPLPFLCAPSAFRFFLLALLVFLQCMR